MGTSQRVQMSSQMRALVYARFSSGLQNPASARDQERACRERIETEGWKLVRVHKDEAISGAVFDRPGLNGLIADLEAGLADVIVTESLDRLSRDLGDTALIYKKAVYAGARILSLTEGVITDLHVGLKGTLSAMYRTDLAEKVRRGQAGRVLSGRNAGGMAYGYHKVSRFDDRGEPIRGLRAINEEEAAVVRRIVREFISGRSPLEIARRLNDEGIPSPTNGKWSVSAINGDRVRGNGILRNDLYAGRQVYNKTRRVYDPDTRMRRVRSNPQEKWIVREAPELRIVDEADWQAVVERRARFDGTRAEHQRRPRRLLAGITFCGACGGTWTTRGQERWGCSNHKQKGTCSNGRTITTAELERRVLSGLQDSLLAPELVAEFVREYHHAAAELSKSSAADKAKLERRLRAARANKDRAYKIIMQGGGEFAEFRDAFATAKAELESVERELAELGASPVIALHPTIADDYRRQVANLRELLASGPEETRREAFLKMRNLIDRIVVTPAEGRGCEIGIEGRLEAVLELAAGEMPKAIPAMWVSSGAAWGTRTHDPIITNDVLYQLS